MNVMPAVVRLSGPWGLALVVLAAVVLGLSGLSVWTAIRGGKGVGPILRDRTNTLLFWGVVSAVLGFLGQCYGIYRALNEILAASEVSAQVVAEGFVVSFMPALFGLGILAFATVIWMSLRLSAGEGPRISAAVPSILHLFLPRV